MGLQVVKDVPHPLLVCVELNPGPTPKLNESTRQNIICFVEEAKKSIAETAKHFGVDESTVKRLKRKYKKTGSVKNLPGQGRKRKLSKSERRAVIKRAQRGSDAPKIARSISWQKSRGRYCETSYQILRVAVLSR